MPEWLTVNASTALRILFVGTISYVILILLLRISGKRSLSKMSAYDFIITVALGSTFATILTSNSLTLPEGILALALLLALQYIVTWSSVRVKGIAKLVKSQPALLYYDGEYLTGNMRKERILRTEIQQFLRDSGSGSMDRVRAVVLETDGTLSVITSGEGAEDLIPEK